MRHGGARVLLTDREFSATIQAPRSSSSTKNRYVIDVDDPAAAGGELIGDIEYEDFLAGGRSEFAWHCPVDDEWRAIALGYTSGTTGDPKGVVTHHRGAYLNAVSNVLAWNMGRTRFTCGHCRCSTATAGVFRGPSPR